MSTTWKYSHNGKFHGPMSAAELAMVIASGRLADEDSVWDSQTGMWQPLAAVRGTILAATGSVDDVTTPVAASAVPEKPTSKVRTVAEQWKYSSQGRIVSSVTKQEIAKLVAQGTLTDDDQIWSSELGTWQPVSMLRQSLIATARSVPPPISRPAVVTAVPPPHSPPPLPTVEQFAVVDNAGSEDATEESDDVPWDAGSGSSAVTRNSKWSDMQIITAIGMVVSVVLAIAVLVLVVGRRNQTVEIVHVEVAPPTKAAAKPVPAAPKTQQPPVVSTEVSSPPPDSVSARATPPPPSRGPTASAASPTATPPEVPKPTSIAAPVPPTPVVDQATQGHWQCVIVLGKSIQAVRPPLNAVASLRLEPAVAGAMPMRVVQRANATGFDVEVFSTDSAKLAETRLLKLAVTPGKSEAKLEEVDPAAKYDICFAMLDSREQRIGELKLIPADSPSVAELTAAYAGFVAVVDESQTTVEKHDAAVKAHNAVLERARDLEGRYERATNPTARRQMQLQYQRAMTDLDAHRQTVDGLRAKLAPLSSKRMLALSEVNRAESLCTRWVEPGRAEPSRVLSAEARISLINLSLQEASAWASASESTLGSLRNADGVMGFSSGVQATLKQRLPSDCQIQFAMKLSSSAQPTIEIDGAGVRIERDYRSDLVISGPATRQLQRKTVEFRNDQWVMVNVQLSGDKYQVIIDGEIAAEGTRRKSADVGLRISGGRSYGSGTLEIGHVTVVPAR